LVGGYLELLPEDSAAEHFVEALKQGKSRSLIKITPSHLELISRQLKPDQIAQMSQALIIGGENLTAESVRPWREYAPTVRLINEYGPTEAVVGCCVYELQ